MSNDWFTKFAGQLLWHLFSLHKLWSFPLRISSVTFGHIYWKNQPHFLCCELNIQFKLSKLNFRLTFFNQFCHLFLPVPSTKLYITLHEKCPNTEFFLVRIFLYSDWIRRFSPYLLCIYSEYRKIRTRKNWVFGHSSRSVNWYSKKRFLT